jgi:PAS domain S-box-containing protein
MKGNPKTFRQIPYFCFWKHSMEKRMNKYRDRSLPRALEADPLREENISGSMGIVNNENMDADLIDNLPVGIYRCDGQGRIRQCNKFATHLWGREPALGTDLWTGAWKNFDAQGTPVSADDSPMARTIRSGKSLSDIGTIVKTPAGSLRHLTTCASPIFGKDGKIQGGFAVLTDTTTTKLVQLEKDLITNLNSIFNSSRTVRQCLHEALREICLLTDKQSAEAWLTILNSEQLKLEVQYSSSNDQKNGTVPSRRLNKGEGQAGMAYEKREAIGMNNTRGIRAELSQTPSIWAIPLILENEVLGVLTFSGENKISNRIAFRELTENVLTQLSVNLRRKKTEEALQYFVNRSNDVICQIGSDSHFKKVNAAFCNTLGYTEAELLSKRFLEFIHPDDQRRTEDAWLLRLNGTCLPNFENRYITKAGEIKWFRWTTMEIVSNNLSFAVASEITEKKKAELQLLAYNDRISVIFESITDGFYMVNKNWIVTYFNKEAERMLLRSRQEMIGKNLWEQYPDVVSTNLYAQLQRAMNDNIALTFQEHYQTLGKWFEISAYPSELGFSVYFKDITERIETFEKLKKTEMEIRHFAKQLNTVLEDERSRIAHEIHDELGQQLAGIKMSLSSLKKHAAEDDALNDRVNKMVSDVDYTIQSLRKFATELRLGILDTLGLISSIEWLANEFESKTNIKCHLDIDVRDHFFDKTLSTCFFRICQEGLTNIIKHADASEIMIQVHQNKNELSLKITDNGTGIHNEKLDNPFSIGLLGMRQRANLISATLEITSERDSGTCIHLISDLDHYEKNLNSR